MGWFVQIDFQKLGKTPLKRPGLKEGKQKLNTAIKQIGKIGFITMFSCGKRHEHCAACVVACLGRGHSYVFTALVARLAGGLARGG